MSGYGVKKGCRQTCQTKHSGNGVPVPHPSCKSQGLNVKFPSGKMEIKFSKGEKSCGEQQGVFTSRKMLTENNQLNKKGHF